MLGLESTTTIKVADLSLAFSPSPWSYLYFVQLVEAQNSKQGNDFEDEVEEESLDKEDEEDPKGTTSIFLMKVGS